MGICYSYLFKHQRSAYIACKSIDGIMKDHHFNKINSLKLDSWHPRLENSHLQAIAFKIAESTKLENVDVLSITGYMEDYITYQIACHLSKCIFNYRLIDFTLLDIPIDTVFIDRKSFEIDNTVFEDFKKSFAIMNNGTTVNIESTDIVIKEMLRIKFSMLVSDLLEKIDIGNIYMASYKQYIIDRYENDKKITNARKTLIENTIDCVENAKKNINIRTSYSYVSDNQDIRKASGSNIVPINN